MMTHDMDWDQVLCVASRAMGTEVSYQDRLWAHAQLTLLPTEAAKIEWLEAFLKERGS